MWTQKMMPWIQKPGQSLALALLFGMTFIPGSQLAHAEEPVAFGCCFYYVPEFVKCSTEVKYICVDEETGELKSCRNLTQTIGPMFEVACYEFDEESGEWMGEEECDELPGLFSDAAGNEPEVQGQPTGCEATHRCFEDLAYVNTETLITTGRNCPPEFSGNDCFRQPNSPEPCQNAPGMPGYPEEYCFDCAYSICCQTEG